MSNKNVRLYDYINIDEKTAQKLFSQYDTKAEVVGLQLIPEGLSTSNYIINIKNTTKKFLLKIYPEGGGNSALEVASYIYAKQHVNVPNIYFFDNSEKVYDRPYIIMDYIDGISLKKYVIKNKKFPEKIAYNIGGNLALLHNRKYGNRALLDEDLNIKKILPPVSTLYEKYLNGIAGTHIRSEIKNNVLKFITENKDMLKKLDSIYVYSHGDFNSSNILIDNKENVWFIDFEYSLSAPIYLDIGKFFRDNDMNKYRGKNIYDSFISGYNALAKHPASNDWIKLARLIDMGGMLALINKKSVPDGWVKEIEDSIIHTIRILKNEALF